MKQKSNPIATLLAAEKATEKARELFQEIRAQKDDFRLRIWMTLLVSGEIVIALTIGIGVYHLITYLTPVPDSTYILALVLLLISAVVAWTFTGLLSRQFFKPIRRMAKAMEQIADGDYTVRLEIDGRAKEVLEVYSGFNMMAQELQATEILQTDFVSNVSHEFKTPISAIEGYATLLCGSEDLTAQDRLYADKILLNTGRLSSLAGSILLLSRLENQQIPVGRTRFRLDEQIRQSIAQLEPAWEQKQTQFEVELPRAEHTGNEAMLHHVWDNLLSNAIKFGPVGGTVTLCLQETDTDLCVTVDDQGPGIPTEALHHVFDKFYQADSSHRQEGNGLGLALVKRIIMLENGTVSAENLPEGGCRFLIRLPKNM